MQKCKIPGIGRTFKLNSRVLNYFSHIKQRKRTCDIVNHFIDSHMNTLKEDYEENDLFSVMGIVQLENPPKNKNAKVKMMKEFEGYWQVKVGTIKSHSINDINELKEFYYGQ